MSATYLSMQASDISTDAISQTLREFNADGGEGLAAYVGPPIGRWTAVYPVFSPEFDRFAKRLSNVTGGIVLTLGSADEDEFLCNICASGKDYGFFRAAIGSHRKGKQRDLVVKKLDLLKEFTDAAARASLIERICDLRQVTFSSEILVDFCKCFGIANALCSFDYIEKGGYEDGLDQIVEFERAEP